MSWSACRSASIFETVATACLKPPAPMRPATILQKKEIQIDVVLTDIEMPGAMNGFAFAKWARSVRPELDIVLAGTPERTAHAAGELCEHGPILTKPYDHKIALDHIKRLLAARAQQGRR